jgi:hypothetical protein
MRLEAPSGITVFRELTEEEWRLLSIRAGTTDREKIWDWLEKDVARMKAYDRCR